MAVWRSILKLRVLISKKKKASLLHIVRIDLLPSFWVFHSLCEKDCYDYFLGGKGRSHSLHDEASIFVWERLWYSISLWQQEILHCAGCKKMLRWRASSKLLLIKRRSASWILMTLFLRTYPQKANWYVLNYFEYLYYTHLVLMIFQSIYLHVLFFTLNCVIVAKS